MAIRPSQLNREPVRLVPFIDRSSPGLPTSPMPHRLAHCLLFVVIALGAMAGEEAWAQQRFGHDPHDRGLPASVRRIQHETGGEVLKAQPFERDGREVYRVKVLTPQGRIRVYEDEPRDQQVPGPREDQMAPPSYPRGAPAPMYPRQGPVYPRQGPPYQRMGPPYPASPRGRHPE